MSDSNSSSGGVGFAGLLTIAFIVIKLCGVIDWSWWWVLSPMLISIGIGLLILTGMGVYYLCKYYSSKKKRKKGVDLLNEPRIDTRSKWQQRLDEMQKSQKLRNH